MVLQPRNTPTLQVGSSLEGIVGQHRPQPMETKMNLTYLRRSECLGGRDCDSERDEFSDGEIVVSVNPVQARAPLFWRWLDMDAAENQDDGQDYWRQLPFQTADLPPTDEAKVAFVRLHADIDEDC